MDIHELAVESVKIKIKKQGLTNVTAVLAKSGICPLEDETAHVVYALDMFHMVGAPKEFLKGIRRIIKKEGFLYIDDGHQPRSESRNKILTSGVWDIIEEKKAFMKCKPI